MRYLVCTAGGTAVRDRIDQLAEECFPEIKRLRETLHQDYPEPSLREYRTTAFIREHLADLGLEEQKISTVDTGVVYLLRGGAASGDAPTVALRADIDALEIEEQTGLPYASRAVAESVGENGICSSVPMMHACGHDGHTAILMGVARILAGIRDSLPGNVKLIFQPGEEGFAGAKKMVEGGVLDGVEAIFGLHGREKVGSGKIGLELVPMAAMDNLKITIRGQGCHGGYPHAGRDPIVMAAHVITALQAIVSREVAAADQAVITIGVIRGGTRLNVIPDVVHMEGTMRTRDVKVREAVVAAIRRVCTHVAQGLGGEAEVAIGDGYPATRNNPEMMEFVREVGNKVLGPENVLDFNEQVMGAEDFSFYLEDQGGVPGTVFRLGTDATVPLHNAGFDFGDGPLLPGMRLMASLAAEYLERARSRAGA
jgi:amidohydrolase